MKPSRFFIIAIILLETFALFCLGALSDRVASQFTLPTPLLFFVSALAIIAVTLVSYLRYSQTSNDTSKATSDNQLSFSEIWQRLKPRKRHKFLFPSPKERKRAERFTCLALTGLLGLGVLGAILQNYYPQFIPSARWFVVFGLVVFLLLIFWTIKEQRSWADIFDSMLGLVMLCYLVLVGFALGYLGIYLFTFGLWILNL